jgi:hypothetical protein
MGLTPDATVHVKDKRAGTTPSGGVESMKLILLSNILTD